MSRGVQGNLSHTHADCCMAAESYVRLVPRLPKARSILQAIAAASPSGRLAIALAAVGGLNPTLYAHSVCPIGLFYLRYRRPSGG